MRAIALAAAFFLAGPWLTVAMAQSRIYVQTQGQIIETDTTGQVLRTLPLPGDPTRIRCGLTLTADGRYLVWLTRHDGRPPQHSYHPVVLDLFTGAATDVFSIEVSDISCPVSDKHHTRFLVPEYEGDRVWIIDSDGVRAIVTPGRFGTALATTRAGGLLFARAADVGVVDIRSGALLRTIPNIDHATFLVLSADEQSLYTSGTFSLFRHDATTGARTAMWLSPNPGYKVVNLIEDTSNGRVLFLNRDLRHPLVATVCAVDAVSLAPIAAWNRWVTSLHLDPDADRVYAMSWRGGLFFVSEGRIEVIRARDLSFLGGVTVFGSPDNNSPIAGGLMTLALPPGTPLRVASSTANGEVTLTWAKPDRGVAVDYQLEVGSAPNRSDLLVTRLGNRQQFSARAPSGTYYVRLRAVNYTGIGPASSELTIVVP